MKIPFDRLPEHIQVQLEKLTKGSPPDFFIVKMQSVRSLIAAVIAAGFALLIVLFGVATTMGLFYEVTAWSLKGAALAAGALFVGIVFSIYAITGLVSFRRSRVQPAIIFSPILVARTDLDCDPVQMHYLADLQDVSITHNLTNGVYQNTFFSFKFSDGPLFFSMSPKATAESLRQFLRQSPETVRAWHTQGTLNNHIATLDWITPAAKSAAMYALATKRSVWFKPAFKLGFSAAAALILALAAWGIDFIEVDASLWYQATVRDTPEYYVAYLSQSPLGWHRAEAEVRRDDADFKRCARSGLASSFREYLASFPNGRHATEAREGVRALYEKAERDYLSKADKADPQAALGMRALLAYLREGQSPIVRICFMPAEGIEGDELDREAKQHTHSAKVRSVGPSFTPERNKQREGSILAVMQASFRKVFSDDLFDLQPGALTDESARFLVHYTVLGTGAIYTLESESALPLEQQEIYIGIGLNFDFTLQVPGSGHPPNASPVVGYRFSMSAEPPPEFSVNTQSGAPTGVYDRMAATAFDEFEVKLANAYGLELVMPENWGRLPGDNKPPRFNPLAPGAFPMSISNPFGAASKPILGADLINEINLTAIIDAVLAENPPTNSIPGKVRERAEAAHVKIPETSLLDEKIAREVLIRAIRRGLTEQTNR